MKARKIVPPLLILAGLILGWGQADNSREALAWIFVAGGLTAAVLEFFFARQTPALPPTRPSNWRCTYSDAETWSADIATLVVDALRDAKIVSPSEFSRAVEIAGEEIAVRLDIGDYPAMPSARQEGSDAEA